MPGGVTPTRAGNYLVVDALTCTPGSRLTFAVTAPKLDPKQLAIDKACRTFNPNRESPLVGKPIVDFTAPALDGKPFTLSSLKGKRILLTFNAGFTHLRDDQKTLPVFAKQLGAELVTVLSDADAAAATKAFGALAGRVVLDKPVGDEVGLGLITGRWNITAVPETYVIDARGIVRFPHRQPTRLGAASRARLRTGRLVKCSCSDALRADNAR